MYDPTESARRSRVNEINTDPVIPDGIDTDTLARDFEVLGFMAPYVVVRRKSDGVKGSFEFRHSPRVYFNFQPDSR